MGNWLKGLWQDESVFARFAKAVGVGVGIYLATPRGRSEWERALPGVIAFLGSAIPSSSPTKP